MRFYPVFVFLSALAIGGPAAAGHPPDVASAARRFSNAAEHLHRQIHRTPGHAHEGIDSHRLASAAEHFHRQVEHGGSPRHLGHDFEKLRDAYRHLKHQVRSTGVLRQHYHVHDDYEAMHDAFHDLEKAVSAVRHRGRHGRLGYKGSSDAGWRSALLRQFR